MQRFVCEQNVAHFERLLTETADPTVQHTLYSLLASARRELAMLNSAQSGADSTPLHQRRRQQVDAAAIRLQFQPEFDASSHPYMLLDPGPGLSIVDVNDAYAAATLIRRTDVVGKSLFEVFPDNPDDPLADGVSNLYMSLRIVGETGRAHAMRIQRYDIRDSSGAFVERHWQPINSPIHDGAGHLVFLLNHVEDVTAQVVSRE
jgi:PAS domain-containing protein